jgi:hypothetical protein
VLEVATGGMVIHRRAGWLRIAVAPIRPPSSRTAGQILPAVAWPRSMIKLPVEWAEHTMSGHATGQRLENVREECKE